MNSIVVYASRSGNTERIAYAIGAGLTGRGIAHVFAVEDAPVVASEEVDLIVIGGPTEAHNATTPVIEYVERLRGVSGRAVATFDTRLRMPRWLSGSAASRIAKKLQSRGAKVVAEPTSFFVAGKIAKLEPGELERAEAWGSGLGERRGQPAGEKVDEIKAEQPIAAVRQ